MMIATLMTLEKCFGLEDDKIKFDDFEKKLVQLFMTGGRFKSAPYLRGVFQEAYKSRIGRKRIKKFQNDGDYNSVKKWYNEAGFNSTYDALKDIADRFYEHRTKIEEEVKTNFKVKEILKKLGKEIKNYLNNQ